METMYFYSAPKRNQGRITVAGVILENEPDQLRIGIAKCCKEDVFVKIHGRNMARGRALSRTMHIAIPLELKPPTNPVNGELIPMTTGAWFKCLAEEVIHRVKRGEVNPKAPNALIKKTKYVDYNPAQ